MELLEDIDSYRTDLLFLAMLMRNGDVSTRNKHVTYSNQQISHPTVAVRSLTAVEEVDGVENNQTAVDERPEVSEIIQQAMRCIHEDDVDSFKPLYWRNKREILDNCKNPDNVNNLLLTALSQNEQVKGSGFLLSRDDIIEAISLWVPRDDCVKTKLTVECVFTAAENNNETVIQRLVDESYKYSKRYDAAILNLLHILGGCNCPLSVQCVHRQVLSRYCSSLLIAVRVGDVEAVKREVDSDNELISETLGRLTALHLAVCYYKRDVIEVLLEAAARQEAVDEMLMQGEEGYSPIVFAAALGHTELVEMFHNSTIIRETETECYKVLMKALHAAAAGGHNEIIEKLIHFAHDENFVNEKDNRGTTPLMVAARAGHVTTVELLLERGASWVDKCGHIRYYGGYTALHWAARAGHAGVIQAIVDAVGNDDGKKLGLKELFIAENEENHRPAIELSKNAETLQTLFANENKLFTDKHGRSTLMYDSEYLLRVAAAFGCDDIVNKLIEQSNSESFVNGTDGYGKTALMFAAEAGHVTTVKLLLSRGASWIIKGWFVDGKTALHLAAAAGRADVVQTILDFVRDVDEKNGRKQKLCCVMCRSSRLTTLITDVDNDGYTAVELADNIEMFDVFITNEAKLFEDKMVHIAARCGNNSVIEKLIDTSSENVVDLIDRHGDTPLMVAALNGHIHTVRLLLHRGANVMHINKNKQTVLHCATRGGHSDVIKDIAAFVCHVPESSRSVTISDESKSQLMKLMLAKNDDGDTLFDCSSQEITTALLYFVDDLGELSTYWTSALQCALTSDDIFEAALPIIRSNASRGEDRARILKYINIRTFMTRVADIVKGASIPHKLSAGDAKMVECLQLNPLILAACFKDPKVLNDFFHESDKCRYPYFDINQSHYNGCTALMYCARNGNVAGCKMLLDRGADPSIRDCCGKHVGFHILEEFVENPPLRRNLLKVFDLVKENKDFQKYLSYRSLSSLESDVSPTRPTCNVPSRSVNGEEMDVDEFAAATAAAEMFKIYAGIMHHRNEDKKSVYDFDKIKRCLKLIYKHCNGDEWLQMVGTESLKVFVDEFSRARKLVLMSTLFIHLIYMCCFSAFIVPTCNQAIRTKCSIAQNITSFFEFSDNSKFGVFLLWPVVLCLYEILCFIKYVGNIKHDINILKKDWDDLFQDSNTPATLYVKALNYDDITSHVFSIGFCAVIAAWYIVLRLVDCDSFSRYVTVVIVALIYGWLQTLEYIRCFTSLHAFCLLLKIVFVKDILRVLSLYVFVLIGFGLAVCVYINTEPSMYVDGRPNLSMDNVFYQVFGTMFGQSDLLKEVSTGVESSFEANSPLVIRLVFAFYILLSVIVLMNMLIAMMNNSYDDVYGLQETLWCIDSLQSIDWVWQDENHIAFIDSFPAKFTQSIMCSINVLKNDVHRVIYCLLFPVLLFLNYGYAVEIEIDSDAGKKFKGTVGMRESARNQLTSLREEFTGFKQDIDVKLNETQEHQVDVLKKLFDDSIISLKVQNENMEKELNAVRENMHELLELMSRKQHKNRKKKAV